MMKRFLLLAPAVLLAACGSSRVPPSEAAAQTPLVYVSSARMPDDIASCLGDRLSRVKTSTENGVTMLSIGSRGAYYVWLTPSNRGTVVKVVHPEGASDDPPEEELRFDIARCTT